MSNLMTRAEGICACRNIIAQVEENDRIKQDFGDGLVDRAKSMEDYMLRTPQFNTITENMDRAIRNMWDGLRKWDKQNNFNDDMYDDLASVVVELQQEAERALPPKTVPKGRESSAPVTAAAETPTQPLKAPDAAMLRRKDGVISDAMAQLDKAGTQELALSIRGYPSDLTDLLATTSSIRTRKLIIAAYHSGRMNGARTVGEV